MSLELKSLLVLLFVTVAAWVWANTTSPYTGEGLSFATVNAQAPAEAPAGEAEDPVAEDPVTEDPEAEDPEAEDPEAEAPVPAPPVSARELRIATLPFLVTEEPVVEEEEPLPVPEGARVTVNPFAPIVRPPAEGPDAVPTPATVSPVPVAPPEAVDVPIRPPEGMLQPPPLPPEVAAPALPEAPPTPEAVMPEAPTMTRLPRALPSATLPAAPALLQRQRNGNGVPAAPPPRPRADLAARVATAVPEGPPNGIPVERLPEPAPAMTRPSEPAPLLRPRGVDGTAAAPASLRGYLLEHEVAYTGSVLGPVGVGIFRTNSGTVVVPLGQTLPQSDIVVTYIDGRQAELTLAGDTTTLTIDSGDSGR